MNSYSEAECLRETQTTTIIAKKQEEAIKELAWKTLWDAAGRKRTLRLSSLGVETAVTTTALDPEETLELLHTDT